MTGAAKSKGGTTDQPVDLVETVDPPAKKEKTESHAEGASDSAINVEKTTDKAVGNEDAAKGSSDPAAEAGKKVAASGAQVKEVARATGFTSTLPPTAEVIDGDNKVSSFASIASFPMASIDSLALIRQLEGVITIGEQSFGNTIM
jgi:hypothetical protein